LAAAWLGHGHLWAADGDEQVIPFEGTQPFNPQNPRMVWDELTAWVTPSDQLFSVPHYRVPEVDAANWQLDIAAWAKSRWFSLAEMKAGPKVEHSVTLECSGNPPAGGLIGNAKWAGTPRAARRSNGAIRLINRRRVERWHSDQGRGGENRR
jgi:hypothetical protein